LHSAWFNGLSNPGADPAHPGGIFSGCCYTTRPGQRQLVESPWGSFLLLAALAILDGDLSPQQC
jgi:unsaturated chondroitin disaccharide hydrolase